MNGHNNIPAATDPPVEVRLDTLCIVYGCLEPRTGPNACRFHGNSKDPPERHICPACAPRNRKQPTTY